MPYRGNRMPRSGKQWVGVRRMRYGRRKPEPGHGHASTRRRGWRPDRPVRRGLAFGAYVLRGLAQVLFQDRARAGAVLGLALLAADWRYGAYAVGGAALGTATAWLLGVARDRVRAGLEGFNSCLTALCCAVFLDAGRPATALLAAAGSAMKSRSLMLRRMPWPVGWVRRR
ncbi:urea transporter [Streptomyces sp. 1222.5]|uniref:urea transporter n=1 Tax=Streptomyces sp. 1222.5 TaxID=1881026 RepID=UPI003F4A49AB